MLCSVCVLWVGGEVHGLMHRNARLTEPVDQYLFPCGSSRTRLALSPLEHSVSNSASKGHGESYVSSPNVDGAPVDLRVRGQIPIQLAEMSPPAFRATFPGVAYQIGNASLHQPFIPLAGWCEPFTDDFCCLGTD
jgi:hypothetical protein